MHGRTSLGGGRSGRDRDARGARTGPVPSIVANAEERGGTIYRVNVGAPAARLHLSASKGNNGVGPAAFIAGGASSSGERPPLARFGPEPARAALAERPALAGLSVAVAGAYAGTGAEGASVRTLVAELADFDAVILGGVLQHGLPFIGVGSDAPPVRESLLPAADRMPGAEVSPARAARSRTWARAVAASAIMLALTVGWVCWQRHALRETLAARADRVADTLTTLTGRLGVLELIRTERRPLVPIFQNLLTAAPPGMIVQSFQSTKRGRFRFLGPRPTAKPPRNSSRTWPPSRSSNGPCCTRSRNRKKGSRSSFR